MRASRPARPSERRAAAPGAVGRHGPVGRRVRAPREASAHGASSPIWIFDLDDTLHHASAHTFPVIDAAMTRYMTQALDVDEALANELRQVYWRRYGATLLGLMRHHRVAPDHFLHHTHVLPGLEASARRAHRDARLLARLPGLRVVFSNGPTRYAERVLRALGLRQAFHAVFGIEHMRAFGHWRPKPDPRMLRMWLARMGWAPSRCTLVEDSLANLRSARRLGLRTVWMQGYLPRPAQGGAAGRVKRHQKPACVCARILSLRDLNRGRG